MHGVERQYHTHLLHQCRWRSVWWRKADSSDVLPLEWSRWMPQQTRTVPTTGLKAAKFPYTCMAFLIPGVDYMHPDLFDNFVSFIALSNNKYTHVFYFFCKKMHICMDWRSWYVGWLYTWFDTRRKSLSLTERWRELWLQQQRRLPVPALHRRLVQQVRALTTYMTSLDVYSCQYVTSSTVSCKPLIAYLTS